MSEYNHLNLFDPTIVTYPGSSHPLGAHYDGHGINFALYSEHATKVELCLFRKSHDEQQEYVEYARINVQGKTYVLSFIANVWLSKGQDVPFDQ
jgi:pullulanase/glycogen debranching enzyme